jgi:2-iminobutanoate/2-iminopropanoate deaminase
MIEDSIVEHIQAAGAPQPIAPFSHATRCGDLICVTGQMPIMPDSGEVVRGSFAAQTHQVMQNLARVLEASGSDWNHVLQARVYLTDFAKYEEVNAAYQSYFEVGKLPARTCIGVTALALGCDVEIDLLAVRINEGTFAKGEIA